MSISILFLCTSWRSTEGGIQTVNRRIAEALAARGLEVHAAVTTWAPADAGLAKNAGVELHDAGSHYISVPSLVARLKPHVVCGHAALTADVERELKKNDPELVLLHFLHHDPARLEHLKEYRDEKERARYERTKREVESAANADLVIAVGAFLRQAYLHRLDATDQHPSLIHLNVGIDRIAVAPAVEETATPEVHIVGRTDSVAVKGLDLFARAGAMAMESLRASSKLRDMVPIFVIRGGKEGMDTLAARLREAGKEISSRFDIEVRPFTTDAGEMRWNWRMARLAVMPSRAEGYGLVAMEALSNGVPAIVSSESGVGRLIRERGSAIEDLRFVWEFDESDNAVGTLAKKMIDFLAGQQEARRLALALRDKLAPVASWESAAELLVTEIEAFMNRREAARVAAAADEETSQAAPVHAASDAPIGGDKEKDPKTIHDLFSGDGARQGIRVLGGRGEEYVRIYRELIAKCESRIDMMGLTLSKFRRDYRAALPAMAVRRNIRIALLDPAFPLPQADASISSIREREERREQGEFRRRIALYYEDVVKPCLATRGQGPGGLEVRLYRALPAVNLFRVDDVLAFGPYLLYAADQETPAMFIRRGANDVGGALFESFMRHFNEIWENKDFYRRLEDVSPEEREAWRRGEEAPVHA